MLRGLLHVPRTTVRAQGARPKVKIVAIRTEVELRARVGYPHMPRKEWRLYASIKAILRVA